jgi:MYXO-CTERM domain-containing protein
MHWTRLAALGLLGSLVVGSAVQAGVIGFEPYDKTLGDSPVALAVTPGDRVVAAVQATNPAVMGWFDTQDWRDAAVQRAIDDVSDIRCITSAGDASGPILILGGDAVAILDVDDSTTPPVFGAVPALGLSGGSLVALAWDDGRGVAYGADDVNDTVRWIPVTGAGGSVDSAGGWPLPLAFTPTHLALVDEDTLLVGGRDGGDPAAALVDLQGDTPSTTPLVLEGLTGTIVAATADGGEGWLLTDGGMLVQLAPDATGDDDDATGDDDDATGDDDDATGDDDDSAGDDDDSAGDDDDSAGDDDDSAGDDDDSAAARETRAGPFVEAVFPSDAPTPAADLLARDGVLYAVGGTVLQVLGPDGVSQGSFALSGSGVALAASSAADGHLYVALEDLGTVAVLGDGPFLEITSIVDNSVTTSTQLEFTVMAGRTGESGTCTLSATIDGTIAGTGTAVSLDEELTLGVATDVAIDGADLELGSHRLHLFCGTGDAVGRASFLYYVGDLDAPSDFTLVAGDSSITATWKDNDDEAVASYDLMFSEEPFVDGAQPTGSNSDGTLTSPITVVAPTATVGEETLTEVIDSLENGTTYYVAVTALDAEGNRGPFSEVKTATPAVTGGVAALTGDSGCSCEYPADGARHRPSALTLLPLTLLALIRRRRPGVSR